MTSPSSLVLLPGAGLGPWIWREVAPRLERPVVLADYAEARAAGAGPEGYADAVMRQIDAAGAREVVLVAHSIGGLVGLAASRRLGPRLRGFVGVAAVVPRDGRSFVSALPLPQRIVLPLLLRLAGTRPPESAIRAGLAAGLDDAVAAEVVERFAPEPRALYVEGAAPPPSGAFRGYVRLTTDSEVPPALQDRMIAVLGADQVRDVASGHLPMLSHPAELAEALRALMPP